MNHPARTTLALGLALAGVGGIATGVLLPGDASPGVSAPAPIPDAGVRERIGSAPLVPRSLSLHAGPVRVPLQIRIPAIDVVAPIWAVGLDDAQIMDAPVGPVDDAVWRTAFWYRGGVEPGRLGTATIAGHVSGGRSSVFARLGDLAPGDRIVVSERGEIAPIRFEVTATMTYPESRADEPEVLRRVFGAAAAGGRRPPPDETPRARLTLVTCAGTFEGSTYDHRLVVFAVRVP